MPKNIIGFMLIDAPHSALNNAGKDDSSNTENFIRVKSIWKGKNRYPYVSGQAFRFWLRDTLENKFDWNMSPVEYDGTIAFTKINPIIYDDDDVFGYMRAMSKKDGGTVTRISPFKNSPLISVVSQNIANDFGVMARQEDNPVLHQHEFYSTILKGIFSLDLDSLGVFYENEKTGYRNMYPELIDLAKEKGLVHEDNKWIMDKDIRIKRAQDVIKSLPYLYGGAKNTSHLTDVTPKIIILAGIDGGNHIFMNVVREEKGELKFDIDALDEVINEYSDIILTDVYIGMRKGFLIDVQKEILEYAEKKENVRIGSIKEMTDNFANEIPKLI